MSISFRSFLALSRTSSCAALLLLVACGDDAATPGDAPESDAGDQAADASRTDAGTNSDTDAGEGPAADGFLADTGDGWLTLIDADWELPANTEGYVCARVTVPRDVFLHEFRPIIPVGTHHTVLTVADDSSRPDGITACSAGENGTRSIYGSGVGTQGRELPEGVAVRLFAGEQLILNLHLFNSSDEPITGRSGTLVKTMEESEVVNEAEGLLAGPIQLDIPQGRVTQTGQCTFRHDSTIFGVTPHMHQTGVYMRVVANSSTDGEVVLYDGPYDFESQLVHEVDFVRMREGDTVDVECTYENETGRTIHWGDSSNDEMCFAGLTRYPAQGGGFTCLN